MTSSRQIAANIDNMSFQIPRNVPSFEDRPDREPEPAASWASTSGLTARGGGYGLPPPSVGGAGATSAMKDKLSGYYERNKNYFDKDKDLPMYKDKPRNGYGYATTNRRTALWKQRKVIALAGLMFMFFTYILGFWGRTGSSSEKPVKKAWNWLSTDAGTKEKNIDWLDRRERVVDAFKLSWDAYERYAWGYDEFHPLSKSGTNMAPKGMGWIIVDALDTLMLMNLTTRLTTARTWINTKLDYDQDQEVNTFETTIRMMGGLLSAHYLSTEFPELAPITDDDPGAPGEDLYLEKAKDLADRLVGAFESQSGVPFASVNLLTTKGVESHADGGASSTAEAATLQLEFKYLSKLTGETLYWEKAEKVIQVMDDNGAQDGLVPIYIYAQSGKFRGDNIRLGSRGDSYYEYLIKQYLQTSAQEPVYKDMWDESLEGVRKHLITYTKGSQFTVLGERQNGLDGALTPKMDHLVCFMPGTIALGATGGLSEAEARKKGWSKKQEADMQLARELMQICWGMYKATATGLAGEITHFKIDNSPLPIDTPHNPPAEFDPDPEAEWRNDFIVKPNDHHNLQRPETVESLFYMWRITGDQRYRDQGWEMFKSFMNYTAVELGGGFTSLKNADVVPPVMADNMESFWLVSHAD
jgi:mannosyl-oligosaccharide alpha-1,2-mannosidase